jgi:hypothetical protein
MWLPEKAVSSHALPPTDRPKFAIRLGGTLRRSLVTGYWTVVQHREVQPGRTLRACAYGFYRGHIARLFPLGEKYLLILLPNPQRTRPDTRSKSW